MTVRPARPVPAASSWRGAAAGAAGGGGTGSLGMTICGRASIPAASRMAAAPAEEYATVCAAGRFFEASTPTEGVVVGRGARGALATATGDAAAAGCAAGVAAAGLA